MFSAQECFLKDELEYFLSEYRKTGRLLGEKILGDSNEVYHVLYKFPRIFTLKDKVGADENFTSTFFLAKHVCKYQLRMLMLYCEPQISYKRVISFSSGRIRTKKERAIFLNDVLSTYVNWKKTNHSLSRI